MSVHSVADHGAAGDGSVATDAFRSAVAACAEDGGTVTVPPGEYVVGSVELHGDLSIVVAAGATVFASDDEDEYDSPPEYVGPDGERPFLYARDCENVTIEGPGRFDGRGTEIMEMETPIRGHSGQSTAFPLVSDGRPRPRQGEAFLDPTTGTDEWPVAKPAFRPGPMFLFDGCERVRVRDVTLADMPAWTITLRDCEGVGIAGVEIDNHPLIPNCDGVSIESSRNVSISDCAMRACDDTITLGAHAAIDRACENVTVTNCALSSHACAIKFGSGTENAIRNCTFQNCAIYDSNRGLGIQHRDEGDIENVLFSDITVETRLSPGPWWGKAEPIYVTSIPRTESTDLGSVRRVRFSNVIARGENGAVVYGHEDAEIEDLRFESVRIAVRTGRHTDAVGGNFDFQPTSVVPPIREHDVPAVYCENVDGVELVGLDVEWEGTQPAYHTHGLQCVGVSNLTVERFTGRPARRASGDAAIDLRETSVVTVRNSRARPGTGAFLAVDDTDEERLFANNDLADAESAIEGDASFTRTGNVEPS